VLNQNKSDCSYYDAIPAPNQANADMLMSFVSDYPTSAKSNQAFIEVLPFDQLKTTLALQFEKVNESQLSGNDRDKFNFKRVASLI
jgi:hypothetical protein